MYHTDEVFNSLYSAKQIRTVAMTIFSPADYRAVFSWRSKKICILRNIIIPIMVSQSFSVKGNLQHRRRKQNRNRGYALEEFLHLSDGKFVIVIIY